MGIFMPPFKKCNSWEFFSRAIAVRKVEDPLCVRVLQSIGDGDTNYISRKRKCIGACDCDNRHSCPSSVSPSLSVLL